MARDSATQKMVPDSAKFPNGISRLADQIHALGLKIGIYRQARGPGVSLFRSHNLVIVTLVRRLVLGSRGL